MCLINSIEILALCCWLMWWSLKVAGPAVAVISESHFANIPPLLKERWFSLQSARSHPALVNTASITPSW